MDQGTDDRSIGKSTRRTGKDGGSQRTSKRKPAGASRSGPSDVLHRASGEIKGVAGTLTSFAGDEVRRFADRQVDAGADMVGQVAQSVRAAADSLDQELPQLGGLVREAADRAEELAETVRGQSASDLMETAADFARRRPAVLLGAAAAVGFVLYRVLTAAPLTDEDDDADGEWAESDREENFGSAGEQDLMGRPLGGTLNGA
jgi:ElaB/YqjD/DUF883 family membrane-anchored ribosome-binding protein